MEKFYIGAGAIVQTIWNVLTNRPVDYGIDDIDIVYYNPQDKEKPIVKAKKGAVIAVGGGDGNVDKPYDTACCLLHHMKHLIFYQ